MAKFCYLRLYLGIETLSCRLLQGMARIVMDWNLNKIKPISAHFRFAPSPLSEIPWNKLLLNLFEGQQFSLKELMKLP